MPLLKGKFDPKQLNSTRLAIAFYEAYIYRASQVVPWENLSHAGKKKWVNIAQDVIDELTANKIIQ